MPTEDISMTMNVLPGTFAGLTAAAAGMNQIVGLVNTLANRVGQTTTILDSMLVTFAAGVTYAGFEASKAAGEFERSMKMVKVVSGQSAAEIDVLSRKANELSVQFKMGIEDITDGLQTLGRAGLGSLDTQISVLETGLSAAKLSGLELSKVLQDIVQTTSLLGGDITSVSFGSQADALTNKILATSMTAPINMNDIVQTLSYSGGTAAAAGINIENEDALYDYLGTVSAFARKGVSGSMAGTALRAFFTKPASQDESVKGAFETLGLQAEDLWKNNGQQMRKVSEQIQIIHDAMNKKHMSTLDQIEIWGKIVGNKMGQQMMKLDETNIREVTQEIQESENATKLAHESMQNFASDLATLEQRGQAMWRSFGQAALTFFRPVVEGLKVITALIAPDTAGGTIFGQLMAGGIIIILSQVIARLGTAWRLIKSIGSEIRKMINESSRTPKTIEAQRAKQMEVYKAMGLTDKQADRLSKDAKNTGFNIQFMSTAMTEFLAKLNEVVTMMGQLVSQTEILARMPLGQGVSRQYNRFYSSGMGARKLDHTNYGALVPVPEWLKNKRAAGNTFGVKAGSPYMSDLTHLAETHGLRQEFLKQLYTGTVSKDYQRKYGFDSPDVFKKWLDKNPSMVHSKEVDFKDKKGKVIGTGTAVMIPLTSLDSFLKEHNLSYKTQGQSSSSQPTARPVSTIADDGYVWSSDKAARQHELRMRYDKEYAAQIKTQEQTAKTAQNEESSKKAKLKAEYKQIEEEAAKEAREELAKKNQPKTQEDAVKQSEKIAKESAQATQSANEKIAKESAQATQNANEKIGKESVKVIEKAHSQVPKQFAQMFGADMSYRQPTSQELSKGFVRKYGMTPNEYDAQLATARRPQEIADIKALSEEKNLYTQRKQAAQEELSGIRAQLNVHRKTLTDAQNFAGEGRYAELMFKRLGLKSGTQEFITDMEKLAKVSKKVADAQNLTFTKIGNVSKPQTEEQKEYNALRNRLRREGLLDKNITTAKDTYKFASGQTQLANENKQLIQKYQIEKQILNEETKRQATIKTLEERELQLSNTVQTEQQKINTLNEQIQATIGSLREFNAALRNPKNKNLIKNLDDPYARQQYELEQEALKNNKQMAIDRKRIKDAEINEEKQALSEARKTNLSRRMGLGSAYGADAEKFLNQKEAERIKLERAMTNQQYADIGQSHKLTAEANEQTAKQYLKAQEIEQQNLERRMNTALNPQYNRPVNQPQPAVNLSSGAMKTFLDMADSRDKQAAANLGNMFKQTGEQTKRLYEDNYGSENKGLRSFGAWLDQADKKQYSSTYFGELLRVKRQNDMTELQLENERSRLLRDAQSHPIGAPNISDRKSKVLNAKQLYREEHFDEYNKAIGQILRRRVSTFRSAMRQAWGIEDQAMKNTGFGSRLKGSLNKHIVEPIGKTNFAKSFTQAFNKKFMPEKLQLENAKMLGDAAQKAQAAGYGYIPPHLLSRGPVTDDLGKAGVGHAGVKKWFTRGGMLNWVNHEELKATHKEAKQAWESGKRLSAAGKLAGGTLGSISMLFGPIEAGMMAISIAQGMYQKSLEDYNKKLTELQSSLAKSEDEFEKEADSFNKNFKKNADEIAESQKKVHSSWKKQYKDDSIGTLTSAKNMTKSDDRFVGGSRAVENALITIAEARTTGSIDNLDQNTAALYDKVLQIREDTEKLAEQQADPLHGSEGFFTRISDNWTQFWNENDWNDDMTVYKQSTSDLKDSARLLMSTHSTGLGSSNTYGLAENYLTDRYSSGTWNTPLPFYSNAYDIDHDDRIYKLLNGNDGSGKQDYAKFMQMQQDIQKYDTTEINKMSIALSKNEKDFKNLGKLMMRSNANSGRIRNSIAALQVKTGLTHIQINQLAAIQAINDIRNVAENMVLPQLKDLAITGYQTAFSVDATNYNTKNSNMAESAIYAATNGIATNVAVLTSNYLKEQAAKDTEDNLALGVNWGRGRAWASGEGDPITSTLMFLQGKGDKDAQALLDSTDKVLAGELKASHPTWTTKQIEDWIKNTKKGLQEKYPGLSQSDIFETMEDTVLTGLKGRAYDEILKGYENLNDTSDSGSGKSGSGSDKDKDKDKDKSSKKNWVNLAICNKKEIPKLNVNLFKKPPNFTILNRNFKLRDVNVNTADDAKSIQNAVKNSIIEIQNRSNPKIIQDDAAEYDPINATEGNQLPTGTKKTE